MTKKAIAANSYWFCENENIKNVTLDFSWVVNLLNHND